ncbi:MAG TPA: FAD-dependent oxidoreductase, partial [Lacipirellulaceae bacterium]|nr:FAD-dependent oxidoreductase [Lacipirellulaceae bacterium]
SREFYRRIKTWYDNPAAWTHGRRETFDAYRPDDDAMFRFEPHVAEEVFDDMLRGANVPVVFEQRLVRKADGLQREGVRLVALRVAPSGDEYRGRMFIDATYEGDLLAAAGVSYVVGRESNAQYDETLNGIQPARNVKNHRFLVAVDPFRTPGDPGSGLLAGVSPEPVGEEGAGDHRVQAYCFRMCMTRTAANRRPFAKPPGYDEARYELLLRNFEAGDERLPFHPLPMPNGKTDTNNLGAVSTDHIGANYDYPEASDERRAIILADHLAYQQGLMWTLANHPRVPEKVRQQAAEWGLAADEFADNDGWPTEMYVREARRMVSDYVMTEHDCRRRRVADDPVGVGTYNMDSHNCQRYVDANGHAANEGDVQETTRGPYVISYRSIVPRRGEATNLLVPVCMSASHIAYGSIRM